MNIFILLLSYLAAGGSFYLLVEAARHLGRKLVRELARITWGK